MKRKRSSILLLTILLTLVLSNCAALDSLSPEPAATAPPPPRQVTQLGEQQS